MKRLILALALLPPLAANGGQMVNTGNHRKMFSPVGTTNHARQFNGSSDFLQSASTLTAVSGLNIFSVTFDLYWDSFANDDHLAMESSASWSLHAGSFVVDPDSSLASASGKFVWSSAIASSQYGICSMTRPSSGTWHHYVLNLDTTGSSWGCVAYVDGVLQGGLSFTSVGTPAASTLTSQTWSFMSRSGSSLFAAGRLSSVAIYSGFVNSTDASALAACGRPTSVTSATLLYYWPINQTSPELATTGSTSLNVTGTTNVASVCSF